MPGNTHFAISPTTWTVTNFRISDLRPSTSAEYRRMMEVFAAIDREERNKTRKKRLSGFAKFSRKVSNEQETDRHLQGSDPDG